MCLEGSDFTSSIPTAVLKRFKNPPNCSDGFPPCVSTGSETTGEADLEVTLEQSLEVVAVEPMDVKGTEDCCDIVACLASLGF